MNEPTVEQIAMMAAQIYSGGEHSPKWSVRTALKIWDEAISHMKVREGREEKQSEMLDMRK